MADVARHPWTMGPRKALHCRGRSSGKWPHSTAGVAMTSPLPRINRSRGSDVPISTVRHGYAVIVAMRSAIEESAQAMPATSRLRVSTVEDGQHDGFVTLPDGQSGLKPVELPEVRTSF